MTQRTFFSLFLDPQFNFLILLVDCLDRWLHAGEVLPLHRAIHRDTRSHAGGLVALHFLRNFHTFRAARDQRTHD